MRVLITGAAQGLGHALTKELLHQGHVVVAVDKYIDPLDELVIERPEMCIVRMADMANLTSVERLLNTLQGQIFDLVILNAGVSASGDFEEVPSAAYSQLITINLTAPVVMASSLMRQQNMGNESTMVFISSLSHATGYPGASVYGATKSALAIYAKSIRKPFAKRGGRVLTVFPGPIKTKHAQKHAPKGAKESKRMAPDVLAKKILRAVAARQKELYPSFAARLAKLLGSISPHFMTRLMRRIIFDKLDGPSY